MPVDPREEPTVRVPAGSGIPAEVAQSLPSARFGPFVRVKKLGAGGMGEVWKAWDLELNRWVALKFLKGGDEQELARFKREAETAGRLSHPNIAAIYAAGEANGQRYIAMQYVEGQTLRRMPQRDRKSIVRLIRDAALAVAAANKQGTVHRDLKPENIMVTEQDHVFVMDFGLARPIRGGSEVSVAGLIIGTPAYMPPEQARGDRVDARADVYALGATLYELLVGRPPFKGANAIATLRMVQEDEPRAPRTLDPSIERDLETIVLKGMEKDAGRRYGGAEGLAEELGRWLDGEPILAHPPSKFYRLRKRLGKRKGLLIAGGLGLAAAVAAVSILLPMLLRSQRAVELWSRVAVAMAEAEKYGRAGERDRARAKLDEGISLCRGAADAGDARALYFLGRLLRRRGDIPAALAALDKAVAADPRLGEARFERGLLRLEELRMRILEDEDRPGWTGEMPSELASLRDAAAADLAIELGRTPYFREVDGIYGRAELARLRRDVEAAERGFREVLRLEPVYPDAYLGLARIESWRRNPAAAAEHLARALEVDRGCAEAHAYLGFQKLHMGDPRGALADMERAYALGLRDPALLLNRGAVRLAVGDPDGAWRDFEAVLAERPSHLGARTNIGIVHYRRRDYGEAIRAYDEVLRRDPSHENARLALGDRSGAREDYDQAIRLDPRNAAVWANRANMKREDGDRDGAAADFAEAVRLDPNNAAARFGLGRLHGEAGQHERAIVEFGEAIRIDPRSHEAWYNRAGARADIEKALELAPADWSWRKKAGALHAELKP